MEEACGVFGCIASDSWPTSLDVGQKVVHGLMGLQHRGQESAGIVTSFGLDPSDLYQHRGMGMVDNVFKEVFNSLKGNIALGHVRYSTAGSSSLVNCQPFVSETKKHGKFAVAHNGQLINAQSLDQELRKLGFNPVSSSDTEIMSWLLSQSPCQQEEADEPNWVARIQNFMKLSQLSYSFVIMYKDRLIAVRDPFGNRPLCIGRICNSQGQGWVVSSESCSFPSVGAKFHSYVKPGEIVEINRSGIQSLSLVERPDLKPPAFCIFEYVYFARPDSFYEGQSVYLARETCGKRLAIEFPVPDADIVSNIPESATFAAIGYSKQLGIKYQHVFYKNGHIGRSFIRPTPESRRLAIAMKFGVLTDNVRGKKIVLVDDSIVRGSTIEPVIKMLKEAGALQVHVRIASPPIKHPCYMGINISSKEELIANKMSLEEFETSIDADSVRYLSLEGLVGSVTPAEPAQSDGGYCTACLTGRYPVELEW